MVWAVCCVYCFEIDGSSMGRTKTDLFEAYAIRSPFESELSGVGEPRVVVGEAAQIASKCFDQPWICVVLVVFLTCFDRHCS